MLSPTLAMATPLDVPVVDVPRVPGAVSAPAIDGVLGDSAWAAAAIVDSFAFPWWEAGEKQPTVARLTWDEEALYVAFEAEDRNVSAVQSQRDDPVSRDDCVEVFFAPDSRPVVCFEPYTCTTDAVNLQAGGIDAGLSVLKLGESLSGTMRFIPSASE